jgi:hypothetical protein
MKSSMLDFRFSIIGAPAPDAIPHSLPSFSILSTTPMARQRPNRKSRIENRK